LDLGDKTLQIYLTPGHTPGSICIHWPEVGLLVGGDLIFQGSFGRYDFPGGNLVQLKQSLYRMSALKGLDLILTGHGVSVVGKDNVSANFSEILRYFGGF
jgi:glyoxylase-like metal-dependent hydrolase (beta-lactamase superfamily II)